MPRACTICSHEQREALEKALVAGGSYRSIAQQFRVSPDAVLRHKRDHLPQVLAAATEAQQSKRSTANRRSESQHTAALIAQVEARDARAQQHGIDVLEELERCFTRVNKLFDACDAWLTDADDPSRYDIGARSTEIAITYFERLDENTVVRRKALLQSLLDRLEKAGLIVDRSELRMADPRKLVLETAAQLQGQLGLVVDLMERVYNAKRIEQFQEALVGAIGEADEPTKQRLVVRLRSLRSTGLTPR